jgi:cupin 2 domain-containing protein
MSNIFKSVPAIFEHEWFDTLVSDENIKIERIVSKGHASPSSGWYDQEAHEWVVVLEGNGTILFENGVEIDLEKGDYLNIPARTMHRVSRTDPEKITIWLAIHYK